MYILLVEAKLKINMFYFLFDVASMLDKFELKFDELASSLSISKSLRV